MTKEGTPFWRLPKRAPIEISHLEEGNLLHRDFITAVSVMRAKVFSIAYPKSYRSAEQKNSIMKIALTLPIPKENEDPHLS